MSPDRWKRIEDVFQAAADLAPAQRDLYVAEQGVDDPDLVAEVRKLLSSLDSADAFIESPVWTDSNFLNTTAKKELSKSINGSDDMIGKTVGVYRLKREIGRGGMGAVYQAERADGEFDQTVAIKLIKRGMDSDFIIRRFRHERQILASFEHPFIARLLDGGTTVEGTPYFVMEFVDGETFFNYCDAKRLAIRDRLKLFQKICSAIEYAHERQIIHRDIKPGNILINRSGSPRLLDFGIAKILDPDLVHESINPTGSMLRMMTPDYASPEQVHGREVTPSSDIYSLGVLLYELLTGHRPYNFAGRALHEVSYAVCDVMPPLPSKVIGKNEFLLPQYGGDEARAAAVRQSNTAEIGTELSGSLDNVLMRSLAKSPEDRYESVKAFSQDISRYLAGSDVDAPAFVSRSTPEIVRSSRRSDSKALAVLPFKFLNLGPVGDTDDGFLGLGLADALITRLSKIRRFVVRPTSSILAFGDSVIDPIKAGGELNVDYIIDGSIKKANDRLRVTIQLLNVKDNAAIWATSIDEKVADVLTLEDTLSTKVVEALLPQLTGSDLEQFAKRGTNVPEAFEHYLRGRYHFNSFTEDGLAKAFLSFHNAIAADREYALAYCGLGDYYNWLGIMGVLSPQECFLPAIEAASKAVELDPDLSEAHATLGFSLHAGNYDWSGAESHLKRAIELNPGNAVAYVWYSIVLFTEGRFDEGLDFARRGVELDPLTPFNHHNVGWGLYFARRYEEAAERYGKVIADFPDYSFGYYGLSKINRKIGNTKDALRQSAKARELMGDSIFARLAEAESLAADGRREKALEEIAELERLASERYVSPYQLAIVHCYLRNDDAALSKLEDGQKIRDAWLNWMGVEPVFDTLRDDVRFDRILESTGYRPFFRNFSISNANVQTGGERIHDLTTLFIDESHKTLDGETERIPVRRNRKLWTALAAGFLLLVIVGAGLYYYRERSNVNPVVLRPISFQNPSIVVLPFTGGDPANENLGVGLADAMTQRLGTIKGVTVISASTGRYIANNNPSRVAEDLGVMFLLRGVLNKTDRGAVLEAEFVNAAADQLMWQETFSVPDGDYFKLQTLVAQRLWTTLGIEPLPSERQQIEKIYTKNFDAYEKYLIGRSQMVSRDRSGLRQSIAAFAASVQEDANFAPAYVGLADAHSLLNLYDYDPPADAYDRAKEYVQRALSIDNDLAEAHASLAYIKFYHDRDRAGAELEFRRAIQMNRSYAQAHHWFALVLAAMGKSVDAISEIQTAERLDPRSLSIKSAAGIAYFFSGQYPEALAKCDEALALDSRFVPAHKVKRWVYAAMGNMEAARETLERERLNSGGQPTDPGWQIIEAQLAPTDAESRGKWLDIVETAIKSEDVKGNDFVYAFEIALAYNHLGEIRKALDWLERSETAGTHSFNLLEADPRTSNLRREPRFRRLIEKLYGSD